MPARLHPTARTASSPTRRPASNKARPGNNGHADPHEAAARQACTRDGSPTTPGRWRAKVRCGRTAFRSIPRGGRIPLCAPTSCPAGTYPAGRCTVVPDRELELAPFFPAPRTRRRPQRTPSKLGLASAGGTSERRPGGETASMNRTHRQRPSLARSRAVNGEATITGRGSAGPEPCRRRRIPGLRTTPSVAASLCAATSRPPFPGSIRHMATPSTVATIRKAAGAGPPARPRRLATQGDRVRQPGGHRVPGRPPSGSPRLHA